MNTHEIGSGCYVCGQATNDEPDHVPPRVLYPSEPNMINYRTKEILTVPSCKVHNIERSSGDETLAWYMPQGSHNPPATIMSVFWQPKRMSKEFWLPREEQVNSARLGVKHLTHGEDFDADGNPVMPDYAKDKAKYIATHEWHRKAMIPALIKIAAGLHYKATGERLGNDYERIEIFTPDNKIPTPDDLLFPPYALTDAQWFGSYLSGGNASQWKSLVSGPSEVFTCEHFVAGKKKFGLKMTFYQHTRIWARLNGPANPGAQLDVANHGRP